MTSFLNYLMSFVWMLPPFLLALTVHEFSHALTATYFGDPTARRRGRLTLNPLSHIDPIGLLCLVVFRIGWAKPVPFNPLNFSKPRLHAVLTAFAGPLSNFFMAWLSYSILSLCAPGTIFYSFFYVSAYINTMLGVFNLLPIHPLDGSHLLDALLIMHAPRVIIFLRRYALFILLFLFYTPGFRLCLSRMITAMQTFLQSIAL